MDGYSYKSFWANWKKPDSSSSESSSSYSSYDDYYSGHYYGGYGGYYGKKYKSSLGWSRGRLYDTTTSYVSTSAYVDKDQKLEDLLKKAYKATRDMVVILDFPFEVKLCFTSKSFYSSTYSKKVIKNIFVATDILDYTGDEFKDDQTKINVICGLGIHEASHLKFTEYRVINNIDSMFDDSDKTYLTDYGVNLVKAFANLLEDNRIEDRLLQERPGFLEFIDICKTWLSNKFNRKISSSVLKTEPGLFIYNLINLIRFQDKVDVEFLKKYESEYKELNEFIQIPESTKDSCVLAKKIVTSLVSVFNDRDWSKEVFSSFYYLKDVAYNEVLYGFDGSGSGTKRSSDLDLLAAHRIASQPLIEELSTGAGERGVGKESYFMKMDELRCSDEEKYQNIVKSISKYIPGIRKAVKSIDKNYDFNIFGCRHGLLDTTKLAEAYQGVPQVYVRQGHVKTNKTTVCILLDESGSMRGEKERITRDAVVLLNEALKDQPGVNLYIYGHSADELRSYDTDIRVYREDTFFSPRYSLMHYGARCENRDGTAIFEVAKRVRKYTQNHCLMFVLSDGSPCANDYHGSPAKKDVHDKVKKVEAMDFEVYQITIDQVWDAKEMFDNVIDLKRDLSKLPKLLGNIIKNSISKNKKTEISL